MFEKIKYHVYDILVETGDELIDKIVRAGQKLIF
jgi:hypothetical protein